MRRSGFTLIELSIVLVIIGLIIGGVLTGQILIKQAELRRVGTKLEQFRTAIYTFRTKYNALAGDMPNAYDFFGATAGCTNNDVNSVSTGCNGNGNRQIEVATEGLRVFQHLAIAGLLEGSYTGVPVAVTVYELGTNTPDFGRGAGIKVWYFANAFYQSGQGNTASVASVVTNNLTGGVFTPQEAYNIDQKVDDGLADSGILNALAGAGYNATTDCTTAYYTNPTATYILSSNLKACRLYYWFD